MKKGIFYIAIGIVGWILVSPGDTSELKTDLKKVLDTIKPKASVFYESLVEMLDELEGTHSDEIKANISKRMNDLQKEVGIINSSEDAGIAKISSKVKKTIDDIKEDIRKGVKK